MIYFYIVLLNTFVLIPLGIKWEIKLKIVIAWTILVSFLGCLCANILQNTFLGLSLKIITLIAFLQGVALTAAVLLFFFYRDPDRVSPNEERTILSPADGTIVYVKNIHNGIFPFSLKAGREIPLKEFTDDVLIKDRGIQIGISMNFLNVHVNRAPIGGKVTLIRRIHGGFSSLKNITSLLENERVLTVIHNGSFQLGVVQIASRLVRRITSYVHAGETVQRGQRIGMIRFGSQVDVLIPAVEGLVVEVAKGEDVKAGVTTLARHQPH